MSDRILPPDQLPDLPPDPDEADIAAPGDGSDVARYPSGFPRMDVARKIQRQVAFLQHFRQCGVIAEACRRTGISRNLVMTYWRRDPAFEAAFQEAAEEAADVVEAELFRRGVTGVDEVVVHQGMPTVLEDPETGEKVTFTVKKYSDGCLLALAKARRPEKYRENHKVEHQVTGAAGVLVVPATADPKSWEEAAAEQQARFRPSGDRAALPPPPER